MEKQEPNQETDANPVNPDITPEQAQNAFINLYRASRQAKLSGDEHDLIDASAGIVQRVVNEWKETVAT